jgi:hypothetical protein
VPLVQDVGEAATRDEDRHDHYELKPFFKFGTHLHST